MKRARGAWLHRGWVTLREAVVFVALLALGAGAGAALAWRAHAADAPLERAATNGAPSVDGAAPPAKTTTQRGAPAFARSVRAPAHAVHLNDTLGTNAAVCTGASSSCASFPSSEKRSLPIAQGDDFGAFDLNVTWTATGPLTQRLDVALRACQSTCRGGEPILATAQGMSPLRLDGELPFTPTGTRIFLEVAPAMPGPTLGAALRASTTQPFHVDGAIRAPVD